MVGRVVLRVRTSAPVRVAVRIRVRVKGRAKVTTRVTVTVTVTVTVAVRRSQEGIVFLFMGRVFFVMHYCWGQCGGN